QREVRDIRDTELPTEREHVLVVVAPQQAVVVLDNRKPGSAALAGDAVGLCELSHGDVRVTDRPHSPVPHELVEGGERLADGRRKVRLVEVVEVDVVGAEPLERSLDRPANRVRRAVTGLLTPAELRREDDLVPTSVEDLAQVPLAVAAVAVRL